MVSIVLIANSLSPATPRMAVRQEDFVLNVSDGKVDSQVLHSEDQAESPPKPSSIDSNLFSYGIHGGPPDSFIVHSNCYIEEIDHDDRLIVLVGFEEEIKEKTGMDKIVVDCSDAVGTSMEMSFDQLYAGAQIEFDFLWPQTNSPITGIISAE